MEWLLDEGAVATARSAIEEAISQLDWHVLQLNQIREDSHTMNTLVTFGHSQGWQLSVMSQVPCPRRTLPGSYEDLLQSLPSRFRTSLRSSRRKLAQSFDVEFGLHDSEAQLPGALKTFFCLHEQRWQEKGQPGVFTGQRKREFYSLISRKLLARDWLYFFYLRVDGKVVAQQFCFGCGSTVMLLQEAFDPQWSKYNLGNTLRGFVFEYLISRGIAAYDFLAGTSRHKSVWSDSAPNDLRIEFSRGAIGRCWLMRTRLGIIVRRLLAALGKPAAGA
jgi:hypothetical protein